MMLHVDLPGTIATAAHGRGLAEHIEMAATWNGNEQFVGIVTGGGADATNLSSRDNVVDVDLLA